MVDRTDTTPVGAATVTFLERQVALYDQDIVALAQRIDRLAILRARQAADLTRARAKMQEQASGQ